MIKLSPFSPPLEPLSLNGNFEFLNSGEIALTFSWSPEGAIDFSSGGTLRRQNELWRSTCFEAFIKPRDQTEYWEVNLSPQRMWNVYHFTSYRQPNPPQEEKIWSVYKMEVTPKNLMAHLTCDLSDFKKVDIGLSAVIQDKSKALSYWAISHNKAKPDFHDEKSFRLEGVVP